MEQVDVPTGEGRKGIKMRRVSFEEIKQLVKGVAYTEIFENKMVFHRFTKEQEELYKEVKEDKYGAVFYTSGVKIEFLTDSETLFCKIDFSTKSGDRKYFAVDVLVDGKRVDSINNYNDIELATGYIGKDYQVGEFEKEISLGTGKKKVSLQFPYTGTADLCELSVDDAALLEACPDEKILLAFGDSITQGYDALHPSERYVARVAAFLNATEVNKGIGGEIFFPELALTKEEFVPDYVTVAYGTNDWSHSSREFFVSKCRGFFKNLSATYPTSKVYVITPLWRKDYLAEKEFGPFPELEEEIRAAVKDYDNMKVISGFELVPHDEAYYADLRLHPNDEGFSHYFANLKETIK